LHIDRAYLASTMVAERGEDLAIYCKAWRVANAGRFTKADFRIDFDTRQLTCPNQVVRRSNPGGGSSSPRLPARPALKGHHYLGHLLPGLDR